MEGRGREYRRRLPKRTVLYEAVRNNLAILLAEASDVGHGLPRYVERDFARYLECGVLAMRNVNLENPEEMPQLFTNMTLTGLIRRVRSAAGITAHGGETSKA